MPQVPIDRRGSENLYSPYPPAVLQFTEPQVQSPSDIVSPVPETNTRPTKPPSKAGNTAGVKRGAAAAEVADKLEDGEYKVARAISSCVRCRTRKQKCDGKLPACSACERAKVECIGFDAISKKNISRNYLHTLEQEIRSLRAQVAALTSGNGEPSSQNRRSVAAGAFQAISGYTPERDDNTRPTTPWDSPAHNTYRRQSDFPPLPSPLGTEPPRSPFTAQRVYPYGQLTGAPPSTSLTRMVHDAALRTGHAANNATTLNPPGPSSVGGSGSDRGGSALGTDSPTTAVIEGPSPDTINVPPSPGMTAFPGGRPLHSASQIQAHMVYTTLTPTSSHGKGKRVISIPPLPPQSAVERLVAAYVDFVGVSAPIIHIPTLGKQLMKLREGTDVEPADIFVVMMVLALSTMASSRFVESPDELRACSEIFHAEAMKHLDAVFEEQSYVGLQAILLLVWYSLLNPEKGSIWFLVGLATRTCVDLGLHNEYNVNVAQLDVLEFDMRRRLFWCTYKMDRLLSQALGRPPSIPDGFINVPLPSYIHDVDIISGQRTLSGEECSYKCVFIHTIKLRRLQSEIMSRTYGIHGEQPPPTEWYEECFDRLKTWLATAPEPRGTVSSEGYAISFHNSSLLLFRPSPGCPRPGVGALRTVLASSSYIIRIYRRMQLNNRISWLWMTSHFSFLAGLSYLYAFFNLYSMGETGCPSLDEATMDVESCLAVLEGLTSRVPSAGACHETMASVSSAIFDQLSKIDPMPMPTQTTRSHSSGSTSPGRMIRSAPISSSRDDPLPNETFPAPLPPITLPYDLSLLDNLFRNPMAAHNKASDYTNGRQRGRGQEQGTVPGSTASFGKPHGTTEDIGLGPYGMAAQVSLHGLPHGHGHGHGHSTGMGMGNGGWEGQMGTPQGTEGEGGMDIFSFLMDEEGGLGAGNWENLEVPPDFSLWT
ncbi:fungal specific transcription factor [Tremella mesenterica]|uniref:Fungal specific transcription factor n=1 Tax=Tremella mesenterica TaxID=5217 RepID=A0A4Q1BQ92_TREME|nr:fungal specific transcription factor [Tremella mesenterica]